MIRGMLKGVIDVVVVLVIETRERFLSVTVTVTVISAKGWHDVTWHTMYDNSYVIL